MKVCKFGGSSLANARQIEKVLNIVRSDPQRRHIVVSAPGKRNAEDRKVTDLLYEWHRLQGLRLSTLEVKRIIAGRFREIAHDLQIKFDVDHEIELIQGRIVAGDSADYAASRGEYLMGRILALCLNHSFFDPMAFLQFTEEGRYMGINGSFTAKILPNVKSVIPGFYGATARGVIKTFSRGGSDVTGALIAESLKADVYENWTDVSGILMTDPRIVPNARPIERLSYRELRELSYMGANVFHEEAMFPVQRKAIATNIRNTNDPDNPGTMVVADSLSPNGLPVTGIAGRKGFIVITVEKVMMNQEIGFVRRLLAVLEGNGISFEHMPSGIDTLSVIIDDRELGDKLPKVLSEVRTECRPDSIEAYPDMAMIAVVGRGMAHTPGVAAKVFGSLAEEGVNTRMINQGSSEISIIVGVENADYERAVRAIYSVFA